MENSEIEEWKIRNPHDAINIDELEAFLHEVASVRDILEKSWTRKAAALVVLIKDKHKEVRADECEHD